MDGSASMNKKHLVQAGVSDEHIIESTVRCRTLMDVVDDYNMCNAAYVQIDTEGFDAKVIKLIDFQKLKPLVIKFEWMHLSAVNRAATKKLLHSNGYKLEVDGDEQDCCAWLPDKISP